MPIAITCPNCGNTYSVPDAKAGQTGRCKCGELIAVPGGLAQPPAPPPPLAAVAAPPPPAPVSADAYYSPEDAIIEEEELHHEGQVQCPHCHMATRQGPICEWCNQALAPAGAPAPGQPASPPPPMAPSRSAATAAGGALIHALDPGSYLKNVVVLGFVYVLLSQGVGFLFGSVRALGKGPTGLALNRPMAAPQFVMVLIGTMIGSGLLLVVFNLVARWTNGFPLRFREPTDWSAGTRELKRVSPLSGLLVGLVTGAVVGLLLAVVVNGILGGVLRSVAPTARSATMGALLLLVPLWSAVWSGVLTAVLCLVYNLLAQAWGGVRFETVAGQ